MLCKREITADVMLRIRHGTNLMLKCVKMLISEGEVQNVFIGRHFLPAPGLNNRVFLAAAADRSDGVVNVPADVVKGRLRE